MREGKSVATFTCGKSQSGDGGELALLEKLGITLDDLEKLFKSAEHKL